VATAVVVTLLVLLAVGIVLNQLLRLRKWLKRPPSREAPGPPDVRPWVALLRRRQPKLLPRPRLSSRPVTRVVGVGLFGSALHPDPHKRSPTSRAPARTARTPSKS